MKDIPMFTTDNGIASLILKEIPYKSAAYIKIQSSLEPKALLDECVSFCRMAGADSVYATGHPYLEGYPLYTAVQRMQCPADALPETDAALFPVQERTLDTWRELYNYKMANVPNSAYMTVADARKMLDRGNGYFVHRNGELLGIGIAGGDRIDAVISAVPGAGADVVLALRHALSADTAMLEVASVNKRAIRLYEKLGFICIGEISRWYKIF